MIVKPFAFPDPPDPKSYDKTRHKDYEMDQYLWSVQMKNLCQQQSRILSSFPTIGSGSILLGTAVPSGSGTGTTNLYIQSTAPSVAAGETYLWIDTSGGDLQFKVEDGT